MNEKSTKRPPTIVAAFSFSWRSAGEQPNLVRSVEAEHQTRDPDVNHDATRPLTAFQGFVGCYNNIAVENENEDKKCRGVEGELDLRAPRKKSSEWYKIAGPPKSRATKFVQ